MRRVLMMLILLILLIRVTPCTALVGLNKTVQFQTPVFHANA
jgi:hypothetical protein